MNKPNQITRTCSSCGLEKPLNAFLQLTDTRGTTYGSICVTCRSEGKGEKVEKKQTEEEGKTTPSGARIGAKEKIYAEEEKKRSLKNLKELYRKDQRVIDDKAQLKIEKIAQKQFEEKTHRETYIEAKKKRGFLGQQVVTSQPTQTNLQQPLNQSQQQEAEQQNIKQQENVQQDLTQQQNQQQQNTKITSDKFIVDTEPNQTQNRLPLTAVKTWLGSTINNPQTLDQLYKKTFQQQTVQKTATQIQNTFKDQKFRENKQREVKLSELKRKVQEVKAKDPIIDYIDKNWNPSSRKR